MSELINTSNRRAIRWQLFSSVSALALLTSVTGEAIADSDAVDRPVVWIELGGELDRISGQGDNFPVAWWRQIQPPPFYTQPRLSRPKFPSLQFCAGGQNNIPAGSLGLGLLGRRQLRAVRGILEKSIIKRTNYDMSAIGPAFPLRIQNPRGIDKFADTQSHPGQSHVVLDFSVGKDVGLGMFGSNSSSVLSLGVRYAQFASQATFDVRARPEIQDKYFVAPPSLNGTFHLPYFKTYHGTGQASRSFHSVGCPLFSWSGSTPFVGNPQDGEATLDWGANVALLFGKQKTRVQHQESEHYVTPHFILNGSYFTGYQHPLAGHSRDPSL